MEKKQTKIEIKSTPPRISRSSSDNEKEIDVDTPPKVAINSFGRFKRFTSHKSSEGHNEINSNQPCDKCEKCLISKENINKSINFIRSYVDIINDKLNLAYHKTGNMKKNNFNEFENTFSPEYYHAIYFSKIDKLKIGEEMSYQIKSLLKSLRIFNEKYDYIIKKHENFEKMAQEYKNFKLSNKIEEISQLSEHEVNEVKTLSEHSIFKTFNMARENFENSLKDLKNTLNYNNNEIRTSNAVIVIF